MATSLPSTAGSPSRCSDAVSDAFFSANRQNWDERTAIHRQDASGFYRVQAFKAGEDTLYPIEAGEIGDVSGRRLAHLQCHFGLDTLSVARRGAIVTGLDFSPVAIDAARALAAEVGIAATFVCGNVYDAPQLLRQRFDIVYATWGTIGWLPDVGRWARVVAALLEPGGHLYFADHHPLVTLLEQQDGRLVFRYGWRTPADTPLANENPTTYTGDTQRLASRRTYEWDHPLSSIVGGLLEAGLKLEFLHEHEVLPWRAFPMLIDAGDRLYRLPDDHPALPLSVSLKATK